MTTESNSQSFEEWRAAEAAKIRCPWCGSIGELRHEASRAMIYFPCGSYALKETWDKHGDASVVDTNASCDYIRALQMAKSMIEQNHPHIVDYRGMLIGGGGHGKIRETYEAICGVLPDA